MKKSIGRYVLGGSLLFGTVFAGPCGITTLQWRDFLTSTVIRTASTGLFSLVEAATIEQAGSSQTP